jgi:plasmid stabilization system protein ParE
LAIARAAEAAAFIAGDKREAAHRWLEGLFRSVDRLQRFPRSGRVLPEIGSPEYREIPYRSSHRSERSINFSSRIGTAVSPSTRGVAEEIAAAELEAVVAAAPRGRLIDERFDCG